MEPTEQYFLEHALWDAREAAKAAEAVIAHYYRRGNVEVEKKADASPVTIADREAELEIKRVLKAHYPNHAYYGEEFGKEGESDYLWLIDPIDGTKSFVRRYPFFSTQIALMHKGELVLGVSSAGQFGETAWARRGGGAFVNDEHVKISAVESVDDAFLSFGNLKTLASDERWVRMAALVRHAARTRGYGDFYHYHLLARGACDAVIESDVNILDIAALAVIVREAGAVFTDLEGRALSLATTSVLAATPALHATLLASFD